MTKLFVTKLCVKDCVCDKVVCERLRVPKLCERLPVAKLHKVVCVRELCVTKLCVKELW